VRFTLIEKGAPDLTHTRAALCFCAAALTISSLGCATSNYIPYETGVTPTANPLVAQYSVRHYQPGFSAWVEFGTDTTYGRQTSEVSDSGSVPGSAVVNVLVAGMLPQTTYHMRAHIDAPSGSWVDGDHTFTTGALPGPVSAQPASSPSVVQFPAITVTLPTPGLTPAPGVELLSLTSNATENAAVQAVAVDLQGNIIWYCPGFAFPVKAMQNGEFIIVRNSSLEEIDLSCRVIRHISVDQINESLQASGYSFIVPPPLGLLGGNQLHHDVLVLPNGHWIALAQIAKSFTDLPGYPGTTNVVGDAVLDIDLDGNVAWAWSAFDHLDVNRHPYFGLPDWTHANSLVYTTDGNLLVSMRHQSWILKLDYANGTGTGDILWRLGEVLPGEDQSFAKFTLTNGDSSQWFYAQHFPTILSANGPQFRLAVYDNGDFRVGSNGVQCTFVPPSNCYSRAAIFDVDEGAMTANLDWQYSPGFFSFWGGSIGTLSNGDVEFDSSAPFGPVTGGQINEVTHDNTQLVWQMNVTGGVSTYRGYRMPSLYPGVAWQK
jgi:arylsulfate sulfotransferase